MTKYGPKVQTINIYEYDYAEKKDVVSGGNVADRFYRTTGFKSYKRLNHAS